MTSENCKKRAEWEANVRKAKSITYSVTLFGFRQNIEEPLSDFSNNPLWQPNLLVKVDDDFQGVEDEMLITSVNYTQDLNGGSETKLELINKIAYTTTLDEPSLKTSKKPTQRMLFQELGQE